MNRLLLRIAQVSIPIHQIHECVPRYRRDSFAARFIEQASHVKLTQTVVAEVGDSEVSAKEIQRHYDVVNVTIRFIFPFDDYSKSER